MACTLKLSQKPFGKSAGGVILSYPANETLSTQITLKRKAQFTV